MAGKTLTLSTWALVSHIFNHQADPHSQAITLIHQLGRDPGITHIPRMPMLNR